MAVLQDVYFAAMAAGLLAVLVYTGIRRSSQLSWNTQGNVLARPYAVFDLVALFLLLSLLGARFWDNLFQAFSGAPGPEGDMTPDGDDLERNLSTASLIEGMFNMLIIGSFIIVYLRIFRDLNPAELFGLRQMSVPRAFLFGLGSIFLSYLVIIAVKQVKDGAMPDQTSQETVRAYRETTDATFRWLMALMAVIVAPLTEELIFRGFAYGIMKRFTDRWFAMLFTAVIFSVFHMHLGTAVELFVLGLAFALAYEWTGCLLVPIFMHMLFNGWNLFIMTVAL